VGGRPTGGAGEYGVELVGRRGVNEAVVVVKGPGIDMEDAMVGMVAVFDIPDTIGADEKDPVVVVNNVGGGLVAIAWLVENGPIEGMEKVVGMNGEEAEVKGTVMTPAVVDDGVSSLETVADGSEATLPKRPPDMNLLVPTTDAPKALLDALNASPKVDAVGFEEDGPPPNMLAAPADPITGSAALGCCCCQGFPFGLLLDAPMAGDPKTPPNKKEAPLLLVFEMKGVVPPTSITFEAALLLCSSSSPSSNPLEDTGTVETGAVALVISPREGNPVVEIGLAKGLLSTLVTTVFGLVEIGMHSSTTPLLLLLSIGFASVCIYSVCIIDTGETIASLDCADDSTTESELSCSTIISPVVFIATTVSELSVVG